MSGFLVTIRTATSTVRYHALAHSSCDAIADAIDYFGIAAISAVLTKKGNHG